MAITPTDIAQVAEVLNRHPDLSPAARRVGLELLHHVDRTTGKAWPSEARMANALGYDVRTIRRGKNELLKLGLLSWKRRGTSWAGRTPLYAFAWKHLLDLATAIKDRLKAARNAIRGKLPVSPPPDPNPAYDRHSQAVERTFSPAHLAQFLNKSSGSGFWKAPNTPQKQNLTDEQLNAKAHTRLWAALQSLMPQQMADLIDKLSPEVEANAVKAERFSPDHGRTGLKYLLETGVLA